MGGQRKDLLSKARLELENPYAFIEQLEGDGEVGRMGPAVRGPRVTKALSRREIERLVSELHRQIWFRRDELWNGAPPSDPVYLLDPFVALRLLGYAVQDNEVLGEIFEDGLRAEIAGQIDRERKVVSLSPQFPSVVRRFTAAHELGHAVLHPHSGGVHRDRPLSGPSPAHGPTEREADIFASMHLMPRKLVQSRFEQCFGASRFFLNEDTAFALLAMSPDRVRSKYPNALALARVLASAESYDGRGFPSLASQFRVSNQAMAIRLIELDLLEA